MADDRANKAGNDAKHFESLLREEQAKIVNLVNAKKSLENEVRIDLSIYLCINQLIYLSMYQSIN